MTKRKGGRPRKAGPRCASGRLSRAGIDAGTPELNRHRAALAGDGDAGLVTYPLGMLLANGAISDGQHWAASRYAWLYAVVHGQDSLAAEAYRRHDGQAVGHEPDDAAWNAWLLERSADLARLQTLLASAPARRRIENLTVFGQLPRWARPVVPTLADVAEARATLEALDRIA